MKIIIETIPHKSQRYPTVGDYWKDKKGVYHITVSDTGVDVYNKMIAIHELVEMVMVEWKGIPEWMITEFDKKFEEKRKKGNIDEPGFDPKAPYKNEHAIAAAVELIMCGHLNLSFKDYDDKVNKM